MRSSALPRLVHELPAGLWPAGRRARDPTLLFVERYRGPRTARKLMAHPFWELTVVMSGTERLLGKTPVEVRPPAACLIPPGYRHDELAGDEVDTIWIGFQGRQVVPTRLRAGVTVVESRPLLELAGQLWLFASTTHGRIGPELDAQLANILHRFLRLSAEGVRESGVDALQHAVEYLINHHAEPLHMPEVARRHGFSTGYFCRQFRHRTGLTPMAYLTRTRLQVAAQLLRQSALPVKEIAGRVGLPDEAYFSRLFKRYAGATPTHYRAHPPA